MPAMWVEGQPDYVEMDEKLGPELSVDGNLIRDTYR